MIVSLLDIHISSQSSATEGEPPLQILEAGTGHGGLTLYLARAIHAANPPASREEKRLQRGAVIHSLDISPKHSEHAKQIVKGFRRGLYANNVNFQIGDVSEWIDQRISSRQEVQIESIGKMFLSHVILDLPSSHSHLEKVASALRANGNLLVFNPSVTQINSCVQLIKDKRLPLHLDRVLELGPAMTGGREWDIRAVKPRALLNLENEKKVKDKISIADKVSAEAILRNTLDTQTKDEEQMQVSEEDDTGWEMICRPKTYAKTVGGGFLGMWKKMRDRR